MKQELPQPRGPKKTGQESGVWCPGQDPGMEKNSASLNKTQILITNHTAIMVH